MYNYENIKQEAKKRNEKTINGKVTQLITKLSNKKDYTGNTPLLY